MKRKLLYLSLILIVIAVILVLNLKSVQAYWYDYIDPSIFWSYLGSWGLQDFFLNWLQNYSSNFFGWAAGSWGWSGVDIFYWLLGFY